MAPLLPAPGVLLPAPGVLLPALPLMPPEDEVPLAPVLGVAPDELVPGVPVVGLAPVAPELDPVALKYASHSLLDTWPSRSRSTAEKLGASVEAPPLDDMPVLPPPAALPPLDGVSLAPVLGVALDELPVEPEAPDAPEALLPVALGEDEEPAESVPVPVPVWASVTPDSANSAAAVAMVIDFVFIGSFLL